MKSSNRLTSSDNLVLIGKVIGVHGLKGRLKIYSYAESAEHYAPGCKLILADDDGNKSRLEIADCQTYKNVLRVSFNGITEREQAESHIGHTVLIDRSAMPDLDEDTNYWVDLLGMDVFTNTGGYLGRITQIMPTGANDVYVVVNQTEEPPRETLIPAVASVVLDVDVAQRRMRVDLPEGLDELG